MTRHYFVRLFAAACMLQSILFGSTAALASRESSDKLARPHQQMVSWAQFHENAAHTGRSYAKNVLGASEAADLKEEWRFSTAGTVNSSPAIVSGVVYFESSDGYLYAVNSTSGRLIWRFATHNNASSSSAGGGECDGFRCNLHRKLGLSAGRRQYSIRRRRANGTQEVVIRRTGRANG